MGFLFDRVLRVHDLDLHLYLLQLHDLGFLFDRDLHLHEHEVERLERLHEHEVERLERLHEHEVRRCLCPFLGLLIFKLITGSTSKSIGILYKIHSDVCILLHTNI